MLGALPLGQALARGVVSFRAAKARAFADDPSIYGRRLLGFGSLNMDPRSHRINTELALMIDAPGLAGDIADALQALMQTGGVHEVTRACSGWRFRTRRGETGETVVETEDEPGLDGWTRLRLRLIYALVPDELL
jgi:hypothetical protein